MTYSTLHIIVITVYKINNNEKFYLLFTMATGQAVIGVASVFQLYLLRTSATQGTASVLGGDVSLLTPASNTLQTNDAIPFSVNLPTSGLYKVYMGVTRPADTIRLFSPSGVLLATFTTPGGSFTLPQDTSISGNEFTVIVNIGTNILASTLTNLFHIGLNSFQNLANTILNALISNILTLQSGETFTVTSTGAIIQLNRIFTAGTVLPLFRFTAVLAGSYQVTSSNTSIVANEVSTSFAAGQDIGDYVDVLTTSTSKMPLTLTMTVANATGELPLNTVVRPL